MHYSVLWFISNLPCSAYGKEWLEIWELGYIFVEKFTSVNGLLHQFALVLDLYDQRSLQYVLLNLPPPHSVPLMRNRLMHLHRSSFSLAKYCSKRLPSTCSVMVIQKGEVAFQQEGSLRNDGKEETAFPHSFLLFLGAYLYVINVLNCLYWFG